MIRMVRVLGAVLLSLSYLAAAEHSVRLTRFAENPLIILDSSATLGDNVNGPSLIRVPAWVKNPLGRYYLYFAHHKGYHIRMAYSDSIRGPWKVHEPGVLAVGDTAFRRPEPQPRPDIPVYLHVASPDVHVDDESKRIVMFFHGRWTDGKAVPLFDTRNEYTEWAAKNDYGQRTQSATSSDGLEFTAGDIVADMPYLRYFEWAGMHYVTSRRGVFGRTEELLGRIEVGPNPMLAVVPEGSVRHSAVVVRGSLLYNFFSTVGGDAPERILLSTIDLAPDWRDWKASEPVTVLAPEKDYECASMPQRKSVGGYANRPVHELRDPAVFTEDGRSYLLYSTCGEQGIAGAELVFE